jgi:hypothetical protein
MTADVRPRQHIRAAIRISETMTQDILAAEGVSVGPELFGLFAQLFLSGLLFGACSATAAPEWLQAVEQEAYHYLDRIDTRGVGEQDPRARVLERIREAAAAVAAEEDADAAG